MFDFECASCDRVFSAAYDAERCSYCGSDQTYIREDAQDGNYGWDDSDYDADTLASAGWGTDEDYGYFGDGEW